MGRSEERQVLLGVRASEALSDRGFRTLLRGQQDRAAAEALFTDIFDISVAATRMKMLRGTEKEGLVLLPMFDVRPGIIIDGHTLLMIRDMKIARIQSAGVIHTNPLESPVFNLRGRVFTVLAGENPSIGYNHMTVAFVNHADESLRTGIADAIVVMHPYVADTKTGSVYAIGAKRASFIVRSSPGAGEIRGVRYSSRRLTITVGEDDGVSVAFPGGMTVPFATIGELDTAKVLEAAKRG